MSNYEHIVVTIHENTDILEVYFKDNTRNAVDEYIALILQYAEDIRQANKMNVPIRILIDVSESGMYSAAYGVSAFSKIIPQISDIPKTYLAYLVGNPQDRFIIDGARHLSSTRNQDNRRVYTPVEKDKAIAWLLSHTEL